MRKDGAFESNFRFSKINRLLNSKDFDQVFQNNTYKAGDRNFLLLACISTFPQARLGLVISKKRLKYAVDRNSVKRAAREIFRKNQSQLLGLDIIVLCRTEAFKVVQSKTIYPHLEQLFKQLTSSQ